MYDTYDKIKIWLNTFNNYRTLYVTDVVFTLAVLIILLD